MNKELLGFAALIATCACRPIPPTLEDSCTQDQLEVFVVAQTSSTFPNDPTVRYVFGDSDETQQIWEEDDPRPILGIALDPRGETLAILRERELQLLQGIGSAQVESLIVEFPAETVGKAGPAYDDGGFTFIAESGELFAVTAAGELELSWSGDSELSSGSVALTSGARPHTFLIAAGSSGQLLRLDASQDTLVAIYEGPPQRLPDRSLGYHPQHGLLWIQGGSDQGMAWHARDEDMDGLIAGQDPVVELIDQPHCALPQNIGIGWLGDAAAWVDFCLSSVMIRSSNGDSSQAVELDAGIAVGFAVAADPCQESQL